MQPVQIIIFLVCLLFFKLASANQTLPDDLIAYMDSLDIAYTPIDKKDLDPFTFEQNEKSDVRIIGDFDGDNRVDYALLVISRESYISVVVFLRREDGITHSVLWDTNYYHFLDKSNIDVIMSPVTGKVKEDLQLKHTGIFIRYVSSSASAVYYWKDNNFTTFSTGD